MNQQLDKKLEEWRAHGTALDVRVEASGGVTSSGCIYVKEWDAGERVRRGIKVCGVLWLCALVSVIIPAAHFVLVPLFLIVGPLAGFFVSRRKKSVLGGIATCPKCQADFEIIAFSTEWPITDVCKECQSQVRLYRKE